MSWFMVDKISPARLGVIIRKKLNHSGNDSLSERVMGQRDEIIKLYQTVCGLEQNGAKRAYETLLEDALDRERPRFVGRSLYKNRNGASFSLTRNSR